MRCDCFAVRQCHIDRCNETSFSCGCANNYSSEYLFVSNGNNKFRPVRVSKCLPIAANCDGNWDCPDGSDEQSCDCDEGELQTSACARGSCSGVIYDDFHQCASIALVFRHHLFYPGIISADAHNFSESNNSVR